MIIDANLATYWYVDSPFASVVEPIMHQEILVVPQLFRVEVAAALTKYFRGGFIKLTRVQSGIRSLENIISEFVPDEGLLMEAVNISTANKHSIYDCFYLALARERNMQLITADKRLANLASKLSIETQLIKPAS